jgi:hypothetical protein
MNILGGIIFFGYGIIQLGAAWAGLELYVGTIISGVIVVFFGLILRFTLPITIGAFLCALNIWGWHWALSALFVAPGLLLIIPSVLASILGGFKR